MKYLYLLLGVLMLGTVAAYVAPSSDSVNIVLDEGTYYSAPSSDSVNLILDVTPPDSCTPPVDGIWEVNCADYCNITSDVNMGTETIILAGTGYFNIFANITADRLAKSPTCIINNPRDINDLRIVS